MKVIEWYLFNVLFCNPPATLSTTASTIAGSDGFLSLKSLLLLVLFHQKLFCVKASASELLYFTLLLCHFYILYFQFYHSICNWRPLLKFLESSPTEHKQCFLAQILQLGCNPCPARGLPGKSVRDTQEVDKTSNWHSKLNSTQDCLYLVVFLDLIVQYKQNTMKWVLEFWNVPPLKV